MFNAQIVSFLPTVHGSYTESEVLTRPGWYINARQDVILCSDGCGTAISFSTSYSRIQVITKSDNDVIRYYPLKQSPTLHFHPSPSA